MALQHSYENLNWREHSRVRTEQEEKGNQWELTPDRETQEYGHLADEALEIKNQDRLAAFEYTLNGVRANLDHYVMAHTHPRENASFDEKSYYGSRALKDSLCLQQLTERGSEGMRTKVFAGLMKLSQDYFSRLEGQWEPDYQSFIAGLSGEWASLKAFEQSCGFKSYISSPEEDTGDGKVDLWVDARDAEYDGLVTSPRPVWAVQVKAGSILRPRLIPARHVERYSQDLDDFQKRRMRGASNKILRLEKEYANVSSFVLMVPNYFNRDQACYTPYADPTDHFLTSLEQEVANYADIRENLDDKHMKNQKYAA